MRIDGEGAYLELERSELGPAGTSGESDLLVNVTVDVRGFSAADQSWIVDSNWNRFLAELRQLEATRQGRAVLQGASTDELRLEFLSLDRLGHMGVRGLVKRRHVNGFDLGLEFGFSFEPDRLPEILWELTRFGE
jgi:hypothetical protein